MGYFRSITVCCTCSCSTFYLCWKKGFKRDLRGIYIAIVSSLSPIVLGFIGTAYGLYLVYDAIENVPDEYKEMAMSTGISVALATTFGGFITATLLLTYAMFFVSIKVLPKDFNLLDEGSSEEIFNGVRKVKRTFFLALTGIPFLGLLSKSIYGIMLYYDALANVPATQRDEVMKLGINELIYSSSIAFVVLIIGVSVSIYITGPIKGTLESR